MSITDETDANKTNGGLEGSSFLFGANSAFIGQLYQRYLTSPNSVDSSWQQFFSELGDEAEAVVAEVRGAPWAPRSGLENRVDDYTASNESSAILDGARRVPWVPSPPPRCVRPPWTACVP